MKIEKNHKKLKKNSGKNRKKFSKKCKKNFWENRKNLRKIKKI